MSLVFDECPSLYIPYPEIIYASAPGSNEEAYCLASVGACSDPYGTDDGLYGFSACALGIGVTNPAPYQFVGNSCSNYTALESVLLGKEKAIEEARDWVEPYLPRRWQ